jgi:AraC-like DNA-binding protein
LVYCFWFGPKIEAAGKRSHVILPDDNVDLLLELSDIGCRVRLFGPATRTTSIQTNNNYDYLGVRFHPGKAPRFAEVKPTVLVDDSVELGDFFGIPIDPLGERLHSCRSAQEKTGLVESLLRSVALDLYPQNVLNEHAVKLLETSNGQVKMKELAEQLGISRRTLERVFAEHVGVTPKKFTRILRFQNVLTILRARRFRDFTDLAFTCGYADQSHLIKDFKALTGRLPSQLSNF